VVGLEEIAAARRRLEGVAVRTPLLPYGRGVYLKPESLQPVGSFKLRGAYNKICTLSEAQRRRGVVAYSSGNHAQGVAYAARELGVRATIVMPRGAPEVKLRRTRALGAEIAPVGEGSEERRARAEELAAGRGYAIIPPYDDEAVIAGQGTVGLEIVEEVPEVATIWVPVGGGGLISGVAAAVKLGGSGARVIGVEPELAADARESFRRGELVGISGERAGRTLADGLRAQRLGEIPFRHIRRFVDDIVTVSEEQIADALRRLAFEARLVVEPSGAVAFAGCLAHGGGRANVAVVSGGNVEPRTFVRLLAAEFTGV
jgi:threonine dehydratase